jgi:ParB-like chromosome segregation protein Spo0J
MVIISTARPSAKRTGQGNATHPYQLLPPLSPDEYAALKADIAKHGILVAVELDEHGHLLDGRHRVRAWQELRTEGIRVPDFPRVIRAGLSEAEKRAHVRAVNLVRRHLTAAQRRAIIADALRDDPAQSDRQVAAMLGVSHPTVGAVRHELERAGDVERFTTRMDVLGRSQPVRRPTIAVNSRRDEGRALAALATLGTDAPGRPLTVRRAEVLAREVELDRRRNRRSKKVVRGPGWEVRRGDFRQVLDDVDGETHDPSAPTPPSTRSKHVTTAGLPRSPSQERADFHMTTSSTTSVTWPPSQPSPAISSLQASTCERTHRSGGLAESPWATPI